MNYLFLLYFCSITKSVQKLNTKRKKKQQESHYFLHLNLLFKVSEIHRTWNLTVYLLTGTA